MDLAQVGAQVGAQVSQSNPKFATLGLSILVMGIPAIMNHTICCYAVTARKIGLYMIRNGNSVLTSPAPDQHSMSWFT